MNLDKVKEIALTRIDPRGWAEIIVITSLLVVVWVKSVQHEAPVNEWRSAPPAKAIAGTPKQAIAPPKVIYVYVPAAKEKLDLPAPVKADPNEHVLQASDMPISDHPLSIVCTQNSETGESALLTKEQPLPWLAAENKGEVRLAYGFKNGVGIYELSGHEDLVSIKQFHLGLNGSVYSDATAFAGIGGAWKW